MKKAALATPPLLVLLLAALPAPAQETPAKEEAPPPRVEIETLEVSPSNPGPDTLCRLSVTLRNHGDKTASQLAFRVTVGGHDLPVYGRRYYLQAVPAGESTTVRLYNFWTTETSRPAPPDGKLPVEVSLVEARWFTIETVKEGDEEVEEWRPVGNVEGLPSVRSVTLSWAAPGASPES